MEKELKGKWEGKVSTTVTKARADEIWELLKDFFNLHKWFPTLATSYGIHGSNSEPGCIRYCAGFSIPSNAPNHPISWSKERLIAIDHHDRTLDYEIVDSNIGFNSYKSTLKVIPNETTHGCVIHWYFTLDPMEGWLLHDLIAKYDVGLQRMVAKMEDHIVNSKKKMAEESNPRWEGKACVELPNTDVEKVWVVLGDFCNVHKWMPIDTCYQLEGIPGQPGLIRYCATTVTAESEKTTIRWAKEKLIAIDPVERSFSYEIVDNNIGFKSYVTTIKVLTQDEKRGCKVEWSFVSDPVQGWTFQGLNSYIESCLQLLLNKMEMPCSAT
ncbi:lachrymatory-factor synthase-like [Senna tora]|uniref:Lachrymatory-factor synthase-like n=1 Tax=Senna tora TaxID=362788 RepID=A0A834T7N6_9FABA|nr:lachrymatory-factor synthase-like [Senna tora]